MPKNNMPAPAGLIARSVFILAIALIPLVLASCGNSAKKPGWVGSWLAATVDGQNIAHLKIVWIFTESVFAYDYPGNCARSGDLAYNGNTLTLITQTSTCNGYSTGSVETADVSIAAGVLTMTIRNGSTWVNLSSESN